jgi:hypothetical protein
MVLPLTGVERQHSVNLAIMGGSSGVMATLFAAGLTGIKP